GIDTGHAQDDELALAGKLQLQTPYVIFPGEAGGVETNMAVADGVAYVPVVDLGTTYTKPTMVVGTSNFLGATGEMAALDVATGRQLWTAKLQQAPYGGATVAGDMVFTTTFTGELVALSRTGGATARPAQLPAGSNAPLAIAADSLSADTGVPLSPTQQPAVVAYRLAP